MMESVAQATDDDSLICAASVTQNQRFLNHAKNAEALAHLMPEEQALHTYLAAQRQRLEQERINQGYVNQRLQA